MAWLFFFSRTPQFILTEKKSNLPPLSLDVPLFLRGRAVLCQDGVYTALPASLGKSEMQIKVQREKKFLQISPNSTHTLFGIA